MTKLRVGLWVKEDYTPEMGGGFGYYNQIIKSFKEYSFKDAEVVFISNKINPSFFLEQKSYQIKTIKPYPKKLTIQKRIIRRIGNVFGQHFFKINQDSIDKQYLYNLKSELNQVVDIIYYPTPQEAIPNFPYIYTLWDLGHLSMYAFPEVVMNRVYESRKQHHDFFPQKALMVFCESETGKKEAVKYLNLNEDKIKVVPLFPSEIINDNIVDRKPIGLNNDLFFIHYPAQFWSHKNHYNLLLAFEIVLNKFPDLKLIFTGSDKGNKEYILKIIQELKLTDSVLDLGFVKTEELKWLYNHSFGLVMPTFLGPTNMPLLEAAALGCPVACTDLPGHIEQLGDYAYYFNPKIPNDIAIGIEKMIYDRKNNIRKTYYNNFNIENALKSIDNSFTEIKNIRFCWGSFDQIF